LWWEAHGHKYGVLNSVDVAIRAGSVVVTNVSRAIVSAVCRRYAHVETVLVTAPPDVLTSRLARRLRQTDVSLTERMKRNDLFVDFRADHVIERTARPTLPSGDCLKSFIDVIKACTNRRAGPQRIFYLPIAAPVRCSAYGTESSGQALPMSPGRRSPDQPFMLALTVTPGKQNSLDLENVGSPPVCDGAVIVRVLTLGICGTDLEIIKGEYDWSPPGTDQLIIGHESPLQRWREAFHRNANDIKVVIDFAD